MPADVDPELLNVPQTPPRRNDAGWGWCKSCGQSYPERVDSKGICNDCRRWKVFLKPVLETLQKIETHLFRIEGKSVGESG